MGFETVSKYGRLLGLGELAGYNLPDEHPDRFDSAACLRRSRANVQLWRRHSGNSAAARRAFCRIAKRRDTLLLAVSPARKKLRILRRE